MKTRYELWEFTDNASRCVAIRQSHEIDKKWRMNPGEPKLIQRYLDGKEHVLMRVK